ncbi:uncharacterized protein rab44 [Eucyclogobius newberryi]|uniref:uncharacterized protein rab44 n=1 Tax=Eucyclogobius newberryi TaxID=166745 RepID=UPI003B5BE918
MSASKKKRVGSQRRSLNPNSQESLETSDTAKSPPVPQGRQRADAMVDLTLNSAQPEIPVRTKLSSKRGNKERLHFKDVTTESSHKPLEDVEDTTYSQTPDTLGIQNESLDESLERDSSPGSGSADFDLSLNEPSNVSTSTITEATSSMPQTSDILDTDMETRSDMLLTDDPNKKYIPTIVSTQEGVSVEKNLAKQMSDIPEDTLPAGVTGQSTCPDLLTEQEDVNIAGSHDSNNKVNAGRDEAGHIEKTVYQQSDESSLPTPKLRKLGSSRRKKDINITGLQHQGHEMVKESNAIDVLEKTDPTIVQNTPPDDTYSKLELNQIDNNDLFVARNLLEKNIEEPQVGQLLADFKDQEGEETKPNDCEEGIGSQELSELSSTAKILKSCDSAAPEVLEEMGEPAENITIEDFLATEEEKERVENKFKDETSVSSCVSSGIPSSTEYIMTKDDMVSDFGEPVFGAQIGTQSSTEELLSLNRDLLNVSAIPKPEDTNEPYAAQMEDESQVTSSVSVTDGDKDHSAVDPKNMDFFSACKNVDPVEQQDSLITFADEVGAVHGKKGEKQEEDVKLGDESQILNKDDTIAPPDTSLEDVRDESDKHITPEEFLNRETIAAVVQEATLKSDTYPKENVNADLFDTNDGNKEIGETIESSGSELNSKDEAVTEPIGEQPGVHATATELHNKEYNVPNVTTRPEIDVSQADDVYQMVSSSVNVAHEGVDDNSAGLRVQVESTDRLISSAKNSEENERDESGSANNVVLIEKQPEQKIGFTLSTDPEEMIKPADEQITDLQSDNSSEPQEPQIQQTDNTNASPDSPRPEVTPDVQNVTTAHSQFIEGNRRKLGSSRRIKGRRQANDEAEPEEKSEESVTPVIVIQETQIEPVHHDQGQISATDNEEREDKVDKDLSQLVYVEPRDRVEETHNEAILSSEDLLQGNKKIKDEVPQEQPSPASKDGQSEDNKPKEYVEEEKLTVPNGEIVQIQEKEDISDQYSVLTAHADNMNVPLAEPEQRPDNIKSKQEEMDMTPKEKIEITQVEPVIEKHSPELTIDNDIVVEHGVTNEYLKPTQVTALFEDEQTVEDNTSKNGNIVTNINDNVMESVVSEPSKVDSLFRQESLTALQNTEQSEGIHALNEPINVHQLTYISDNEAHEEMDNSFLQQAEQPVQGETIGAPSTAAPLVDVTEVNAPNADHDHVPRRKLGSSRRTKARKPEPNESEVTGKVTEFVQSTPTEDLPQQERNNPNFASEVADKLKSENDTKHQDAKEKTVNSEFQEKSLTEETQKEATAGQADSFPVKDLKENVVADIFAKQEQVGIAAVSSVEQPNAEKDEKEEVLQTEEAALIEGMTTGANLQPDTSEAIPPSSPGRRRKMGSTRKNLTPKKESPPEESVTLMNVGKEVASSISNENKESETHDGLLAHAASVHQQPPDEETPNSQQDDQEKLRSVPVSEVSSHPRPDVMTEEAAIARRRKMGSHRKPHTDQSIKQGQDSDENLLHPMEERRAESPKLGQKSQVNERDNKALTTASAFNIKGDSRPVGQKMPQQMPQPSTTVRRAQQSNIRLAAGYDPSSSKYEVVMIGDSSVGKTSFMQWAQSGRFSLDIPASIGMDSNKWTGVVDGRTVVLHLWDTAGQERFRSMTKQLLHRAQAFLLMYDITCAQTFSAVSYWANCIKEGAAENVVVLLLGNKSDSKERKIRREEGEIIAQENGFTFLECSAASGENVNEALETVARLLYQKNARREEPPLELRKPEPRNKGCC